MALRLMYTPYVWPAVLSTVFPVVLGAYSWRRRSVHGALPFTALMACGALWALGSALEFASPDVAAKILWVKVQSAWQLPLVTAQLWFAVEYSDLKRWLVRRNFIFSATPPILWLLLILTNDEHRLIWSRFSFFQESVYPARNLVAWIFIAYGWLLAVVTVLVFAWLFRRSPLHRVAVALCLCGQIVALAAHGFKTAGAIPGMRVDPVVLSFDFAAVMFALALFRFRLFDLIPIARGTVIDQMREGMLVLDSLRRIMDLNPAAERILGVFAARARGVDVGDLLPGCSLEEQSEITLGAGDEVRHYAIHESTLNSRRGVRVGTLILLDDVTGQKRAHAQLVEQQRALATLRERDRVARELHDTLGQVLGYIKMEAAVAQTYLERGEGEQAKLRIARVETAAQDSQNDVREYILGTRAGVGGAPFLPTLSEYLRQFAGNYGLATELNVSPDLADRGFELMTGAQLLRIIQEALTNVRKHARARGVNVRIGLRDGHVEATVQDDGCGFDRAAVRPGGGERFGLQVMQERAEEVGGTVQVHSAPGEGTRVVITMP